MLFNSVLNINTSINKICSTLHSMTFSASKIASLRLFSNQSEKKPSKTLSPIKFDLTEDLPAIPENYGFPGDENVKTLFELKRIRTSFKYGNPPKLRRRIKKGPLVMRILPISNCSNRKFYRLAITRNLDDLSDPFLEDLGSIDPMPNRDNQILIALNIERIKYHLSKGVILKGLTGEFLGLAGFLPVHPNSYLKAFKNCEILKQKKPIDDQNVEAS